MACNPYKTPAEIRAERARVAGVEALQRYRDRKRARLAEAGVDMRARDTENEFLDDESDYQDPHWRPTRVKRLVEADRRERAAFETRAATAIPDPRYGSFSGLARHLADLRGSVRAGAEREHVERAVDLALGLAKRVRGEGKS